MRRKFHKAVDLPVTLGYLQHRANMYEAAGYPKAKWMEFCETLLKDGYKLTLYEAKQSYSKYITVTLNGHPSFKVRFSNHKPIPEKEAAGSCDFFVGVTNLHVTNTAMALDAVREHFQENKNEETTSCG